MAFFTFRQNNSGGSFDHEEGKFGYAAIIEASCARKANGKARAIGLYFDGIRNGKDCGCCGDRWGKADEEGEPEPRINGTPIKQAAVKTCTLRGWWGLPIYVHYLDGRVEKYTHGSAEPVIVTSSA
jgi:hypothetical protein